MKIQIAKIKTVRKLVVTTVISLVFIVSSSIQVLNSDKVSATKYDDLNNRINALNSDIANYQAQAAILSAQADTLQIALAKITQEKLVLQAQIDISQAKYDKLVIDITNTETEIQNNRDGLGKILADMYVDDNITPLEMLASSGNIGDFLDKQESRNSVQNEMAVTIKKIKELKIALEKQKTDVERVLADQKLQKEALVAKETEQQDLVDKTKGQEAAYQSLVAQSNSEIQQLKAEQAAYLASLITKPSNNVTDLGPGDPNKGGYPAYLANSPQDSIADPWGMFNRECVSYTAWKVQQAYGNMPYWGGIGNAWQWALSGYAGYNGTHVNYETNRWHTANTATYGVPSGSEPKVGSVAIVDGLYGHSAWVEEVIGDRVRVSQYNYYNAGGPGWGHYSEMTVNKSFFSRYIYFGEW